MNAIYRALSEAREFLIGVFPLMDAVQIVMLIALGGIIVFILMNNKRARNPQSDDVTPDNEPDSTSEGTTSGGGPYPRTERQD